MLRYIAVIAGIVAVSLGVVLAHPGGLDKKGGHFNRKTGEYHFHRPQSPAPAKPSQEAPSKPASKKLYEADYRDWWAKQIKNSKMEVTMKDGTRCDIVTDSHAIEVEWSHKWYEGFGQSLWYSFQTNKTPGVVMILRSEADKKYAVRLRSLAKHHNIEMDVWEVGPGLTK